jgi:hypothetical protein
VRHERKHELAVLYQGWQSACRIRLAGADFKPPSAATFKRPGRERLWKRHHEDVRSMLKLIYALYRAAGIPHRQESLED